MEQTSIKLLQKLKKATQGNSCLCQSLTQSEIVPIILHLEPDPHLFLQAVNAQYTTCNCPPSLPLCSLFLSLLKPHIYAKYFLWSVFKHPNISNPEPTHTHLKKTKQNKQLDDATAQWQPPDQHTEGLGSSPESKRTNQPKAQ